MKSYMHASEAKPICAWKRHTNTGYKASSPPSSLRAIAATPSHKYYLSNLQVRAQSIRDEGKSSNMVDASLRILRERMEEVKNKERLERCCRRSEQGWNYEDGYYNISHHNYKTETLVVLSQCFDLIATIAGTVGLTIVSATFLLCLVSLILHLNHYF